MSTTYGIVFDVDGVLLRDGHPIEGAVACIQKIMDNGIPHLYVTNGGGETEQERAEKFSQRFGIEIKPEKIILSHTPLRGLSEQFSNSRILTLGRHEEKIARIMELYGFNNFTYIDRYIDDHAYLSPYTHRNKPNFRGSQDTTHEEPIKAIFVLETPDNWQATLQTLIDVLISDGRVGIRRPSDQAQIPVLVANPDFVYGGAYKDPRFTTGAFVECLKHLYKLCTNEDLIVEQYGKPLPSTYKYANNLIRSQTNVPLHQIYAIGDNPKSDIAGANAAGDEWWSILVKTGIFKGDNDIEHPAKTVCDTIVQAIEMISSREKIKQTQ